MARRFISTGLNSPILQSSGGDVFCDEMFEYSLGFEPGQLGEDTGLGSGGEGHLAGDEATVDDGA